LEVAMQPPLTTGEWPYGNPQCLGAAAQPQGGGGSDPQILYCFFHFFLKK